MGTIRETSRFLKQGRPTRTIVRSFLDCPRRKEKRNNKRMD